MARWFYDGLREPEVTVAGAAGSRTVQVIEAAMNFLFDKDRDARANARIERFARASEVFFTLLELACAASRAPHGARVD